VASLASPKAGKVKLFDNRSSIKVHTAKTANKEVFCLRYSPDSRFLAAGTGDGSIRVFNSLGHLSYTLSVPTSNNLPTTCIRFRPPMGHAKTKNVFIASNADGSISHWHMMSQTCLYRIEEADNQIYALDYAKNGEAFVSAGRDTKLRIYDESTKQLVSTLSGGNKAMGTTGHSNRVYAVKYHPVEQHLLVSGGWDNTVQVRNAFFLLLAARSFLLLFSCPCLCSHLSLPWDNTATQVSNCQALAFFRLFFDVVCFQG
jgi:WD40 repeat protein